METMLPLRPLRMSHSHDGIVDNIAQPPQLPQYNPYCAEYWRSPAAQNYSTSMQPAGAGSCHGFVNANIGVHSYHQTPESHGGLESTSMNTLNALRLRAHSYGSAYSGMHASM